MTIYWDYVFVNLDYVLFVIPVSSTCIVLFNCRLNRYRNRYRYGIMRNRQTVMRQWSSIRHLWEIKTSNEFKLRLMFFHQTTQLHSHTSTLQYYTVQYYTVLYYTVRYYTVWYYTLSHDWQNSRLLIGQLAYVMKLY